MAPVTPSTLSLSLVWVGTGLKCAFIGLCLAIMLWACSVWSHQSKPADVLILGCCLRHRMALCEETREIHSELSLGNLREV